MTTFKDTPASRLQAIDQLAEYSLRATRSSRSRAEVQATQAWALDTLTIIELLATGGPALEQNRETIEAELRKSLPE